MSHILSECNSLNNLPDILKRNTKNLTNMIARFARFSSLINIPKKFLIK